MKQKFILRLTSIFVFVFILMGIFITTEAAVKKVAIGTFANGAKSRYGTLACSNLESNIFSGLVQNKNYEIVERAQLDQIFRELGLQNSGVVDSKSAIEIGNLSGADYTLVGKVLTAEVIPFDNILYRGYKGKVAFEMHFVDNKTGLVLYSDVISDTDSQMYSPGVSVNERVLISGAAHNAAIKVLEK